MLVLLLLVSSVFVSSYYASGGLANFSFIDVNDGLNYTTHIFTSTGNGNLSVSGNFYAKILVVASGGGGGGSNGGGGGAGGLIYDGAYSLSDATNYSVVIGTGGAGGNPAGGKGANGTNSSFDTLVALGGGGGGGETTARVNGNDGGSGGGGGGAADAPPYDSNNGTGRVGQGYSGGSGVMASSKYAGGGGGGAGGVGVAGVSGVSAGAGGVGLNFSINGNNSYYAGGGGGGGYSVTFGGAGLGGGGNGSVTFGGGDGIATTGGGGGGSGNGGTGGAGGSGIVIVTYLTDLGLITPEFITPTPLNNSHNNTQVNISLNCSLPVGATFYLWFDNVDGSTPVLVNSTDSYWVTNVTSGGVYYFRGACYNGIGSTNTSVRVWVYDITPPVINVADCNEFNSSNSTILNPFDSNVSFCFNFSDDVGLFAYEVLVTDGSGGLVYNKTNISLGSVLNTSFVNYSSSILVAGRYFVNVSVSDIHTNNVIGDYGLVESKDSLLFNTAEGNIIKISGVDSVSSSSDKLVDRYDFGFVYDNGKVVSEKVFYVESLKGGLYYLSDSKFKAHFVIFNSDDFSGNWVDFEGVVGIPKVDKVGDNKYRVTFDDLNSDELIFNSIGGLNIVSGYYSFVVGNYNVSGGGVFAGVNHSLWVNFNASDDFNVSNVSFSYNNVSYIPSCYLSVVGYNCTAFISAGSNGTLLYYWFFNVDNVTTLYNFTLNETISLWSVGLCGVSGDFGGVNFTFYDENIPSVNQNASLEVELFIWVGDVSNNKTLNFNFTDYLYNYSLCIDNSSVMSNAYLKFVNNDGFTNRFYWFNVSLSNTSTLNVSLYVFNYTAGVSNLRITSRNSLTYQYFSGVVASLERRYLSEGVYRVVQMDLSDDFGLLFFNVIEESVDYRIVFRDVYNRVLKTSSNLKFSCDAGVCDLTAVINPSGEVVSVANVSWSYVYDNTSGLINVSWVDLSSLVSSVRIWVAKEDLTGEFLICNVSQAGFSGSYSCNVTGYAGEVFVRLSKTSSPESDVTGFWVKLSSSASSLSSLMGGSESAFWSFLLMITISLLGIFSIAGAVVLGVVGFVALYSFGLFSGISVVVVIVALVMGLVIAFKIKR